MDLSAQIVETIDQMPQGGRYANNRADLEATVAGLNAALSVDEAGYLRVTPDNAYPASFCTSGTYLLFLTVIADLQRRGRVKNSEALGQALIDIGAPEAVIDGKRDGIGFFGHWNANGPGIAELFALLDLGENHDAWERAQPGDFLKMWWTEAIGRDERGHVVVYLGLSDDRRQVKVWSSNLQNEDGTTGYGTMWVDRDRIKHARFSRLERPENVIRWLELTESQRQNQALMEMVPR